MEKEILKKQPTLCLSPHQNRNTRVILYFYLNLESSRSPFGDFISR